MVFHPHGAAKTVGSINVVTFLRASLLGYRCWVTHLADVKMAPLRPPKVDAATKSGMIQAMTPSVRSANVCQGQYQGQRSTSRSEVIKVKVERVWVEGFGASNFFTLVYHV